MVTVYYIMAQRIRRFEYPIAKIILLSGLALFAVLVAQFRLSPWLDPSKTGVVRDLLGNGLYAAIAGPAWG